ncbi:MAG: NUDIX domain-containing protein [Alphaproteobacteria bacterium]|jgi:ADP-ribose pyrophosphatase YjhB (NUDIX family)|nr:NUDIX domain-containing protein [Alphaproteobacteria bacterium]
MRERPTARVLLLDSEDRILLLKGRLPTAPEGPGAWYTVGGGVEPGESLEAAARREMAEETGLEPHFVSQPLWWSEQVYYDRKGRPVLFRQAFLMARCDGGDPSRAGWTPLEQALVDDIRWWTLAELETTDEPVYPEDLASRLRQLLAGEV